MDGMGWDGSAGDVHSLVCVKRTNEDRYACPGPARKGLLCYKCLLCLVSFRIKQTRLPARSAARPPCKRQACIGVVRTPGRVHQI